MKFFLDADSQMQIHIHIQMHIRLIFFDRTAALATQI